MLDALDIPLQHMQQEGEVLPMREEKGTLGEGRIRQAKVPATGGDDSKHVPGEHAYLLEQEAGERCPERRGNGEDTVRQPRGNPEEARREEA